MQKRYSLFFLHFYRHAAAFFQNQIKEINITNIKTKTIPRVFELYHTPTNGGDIPRHVLPSFTKCVAISRAPYNITYYRFVEDQSGQSPIFDNEVL